MSFNLPLSKKLPLLIIGISVVVALGLGILSYVESSSAVDAEVEKKLQVALESRKTTLENYLKGIEEDLKVTASNPNVVLAIKEFT